MDFYQICNRKTKDGTTELYPDFTVGRSKDLMVRSGSFYAIWDPNAGLWSTDEYDVQRLVDNDLTKAGEEHLKQYGSWPHIKNLKSFGSNSWNQFRRFMNNISDNNIELDQTLTFANTEVKKEDYISKRLSYPLTEGDYSAWDELVGTLYSVEERAKIEWTIGAILSGDSRKIQKFLVFYGPAGTGKSTILNIIEKLFAGYTTTFEAKALGGNNNAFATEAFKGNPLVAIQHDGDLSKIEDNTKLNSIVSHEEMTMNEKYKASYTSRVNAFLLMGTNQPVKISDAKSGIIRRLIDVHPTGVQIPTNHYHTLMGRIDFELGAIAYHCLEVYREMGKNYYNTYRPMEMMLQTDVFFNFIEAHFDIFKSQNGVTLKQAYTLYKEFCDDTGIERVLPQYKVREELRNYFDEFHDRGEFEGINVRSLYLGFNANKFKEPVKDKSTYSLVMDETKSIFDELFANQPAQEGTKNGTPKAPWDDVVTTLRDVDTGSLHFVRVPTSHIIIDFDLKDDSGEKSLEANLAAASSWPPTYAEVSKSGAGIHLHYQYTGDPTELASEYSNGIEVKVYVGKSSLRRRLTKCNNIPIAELSTGLPLKEKKMIGTNTIQSEKGLRDLIDRNLKKEIHPGTKPSIDFIHEILEEAYEGGMIYDVTDLRSKIVGFANNSTNQAMKSLKVVQSMKFKSEEAAKPVEADKESPISFFDCEVFPNLLVICWKYEDSDNVVRMINPSPQEVEELINLRLVGFNNRRYDNHILYARMMGYNNEQIYKLSMKIISGSGSTATFGEAYGLSYADIYEFSSKKQGLKKFQIELGITHKESRFPWDEPLDPEHWDEVVEYCVNDVMATEAVFKARRYDFDARRILSDLSGLSVNDTTQKHTARIIFGKDRNPQASFVYTNLSKEFPGYSFDMGKSSYKGESPSEGGYVYSEPGMYEDVAVLDVASMHPTSIQELNLFGQYTPNFVALKDARVAIKHRDYDAARKMLGGKLEPYLKEEDNAEALSFALKIVINIVYGLTSAKFDNPFRDVRNKDNIVAKRGALFMIDLKDYVQNEMGLTVAHIKTDSIKIPGATQDHIQEVFNFGAKYGYTFEHEATYDKFCLVNDAVYIAKEGDLWHAVGAQFQHPYVYKTLFTGEAIEFDDICETKEVKQGSMHLDEQHDVPGQTVERMQHIGRTGRFVPVSETEDGGGMLYRVKDDKCYAVTGTKGYLWLEAEIAKSRDAVDVNYSYFDRLVEEAKKTIEKYGEFERLVS